MVHEILWKKSGHWDKFKQNMFITQSADAKDEAEGDYMAHALAIKPMNCPGHVQIFNSDVMSYRQLPLRMAEFGCCHRNEPSGALHGIMRVRQFTQDDAHIFCTPEQILEESKRFCELVFSVYKDFGFEDVLIKLSTRPENFAGDPALWDRAEKALEDVMGALGRPFELQPGEGAFYGPKLEFTLVDRAGRQWQCGTLQLDFVLPERLDAKYTDSDGEIKRPVMLHRAILGSIERFIGILLEHHQGKLPQWVAPTQVGIVTVNANNNEYAQGVLNNLKEAGVRVEAALDDRHFNVRMKEFMQRKVPVVFFIGDKEVSESKITVREGKQQGVLGYDYAIQLMEQRKNPPSMR